MTQFKVGDKVKIKRGSRWYGSGPNNPVDTKGTIIRIGSSFLPVEVRWREDSKNSYNHEDLELMEKTMDDLEVGDLLVKEYRDYDKQILAVFENSEGVKYVAAEDTDDGSTGAFRVSHLTAMGWGLKPSEPEVKEVTLEEVAKKFGVDTSKIRIKE